MPAKMSVRSPSLAQLAKSGHYTHNRIVGVVAMSRQSPFALREGLHGCTSLNRILSMHGFPLAWMTCHWSKSEEKKRKHYPAPS